VVNTRIPSKPANATGFSPARVDARNLEEKFRFSRRSRRQRMLGLMRSCAVLGTLQGCGPLLQFDALPQLGAQLRDRPRRAQADHLALAPATEMALRLCSGGHSIHQPAESPAGHLRPEIGDAPSEGGLVVEPRLTVRAPELPARCGLLDRAAGRQSNRRRLLPRRQSPDFRAVEGRLGLRCVVLRGVGHRRITVSVSVFGCCSSLRRNWIPQTAWAKKVTD